MNNTLQTIYNNVAYKMWFINFFKVDRDIMFIIKSLLQYHSLKRIIKPPSINHIENHDFNTDYIDDQGICFIHIGKCKYKDLD